jgi:hypothetical protein
MKKITVLLSIALALLIVPACSRVPSPKKVVKAYQAAHNAGDVDSVMALIYPDSRADFAGMGPSLWGPDELRGKAAYDSALHSQYTLAVQRTAGDTVFLDATENNDWLKGAGLPPFKFAKFYLVIKEGKIHYLRAELDNPSIDRFNGVMSSVIPWAEENRPTEFNRLTSELYLFSAENARVSMAILRDWKSSGVSQK